MTRIAWFHPFSGIAGDMALAALLDAGAELAAVEAACRRLPLGPWELRARPVVRGGLAGTHVEVVAEQTGHHRRAAAILAMVEGAGLEPRVAQRATAVFERLAAVEGRLHGVAPEEVEFHEVGSVDSIVDVVGVCAALESLGVDAVESAPPAMGLGTVRAAHGVLPNPPPAVTALLEGVPVHGVDVGLELTTPTGAALLAVLARRFGPLPAMTLGRSGYGAGSRDLPGRPNLLQVVLGEAADPPAQARAVPLGLDESMVEPVALVETTLDDVTGEVLGHTVAALLAAGALDAWTVPATMKKGRPGHVLSVLCRPADVEPLRALVAAETGTLGVRITSTRRWVAPRQIATVSVGGHDVRVKVGPHRAKAEHDDAAALAAASGKPLAEVARAAEAAYAAGVGVEGEAAAGTAAEDAGAEDSLRHSER